MRFRLLRFCNEATAWDPKFALQRLYAGGPLVQTLDGSPLIFDDVRSAVYWVRDNFPQGSVEWPGSTY